MSAVLKASAASARHLERAHPALVKHFELVASAPGGVARLRELVLQLAVRGKLLKQERSDEHASALLGRVLEIRKGYSQGRISSPVKTKFNAPYELPDTWAWAELGSLVGNIGSGWSPACDDGERADSSRWAVLRTTAVQQMKYRPREHKALPRNLTPRPDLEVRAGDILVTRAGPIKRVGVSCYVSSTPPRLMISDKIVRFQPVGSEMLPAFLVLALNAGWTQKQLESFKTGMAASQVNVSQTDLKRLPVPVCSKPEQARIVARVDELMRLCDALEEEGRLEADQHQQLLNVLLDTLSNSASPHELAANWQRVAAHFDVLLDRPEAVDVLERTIVDLAVRGLLVSQQPTEVPTTELLCRVKVAPAQSRANAKSKPETLDVAFEAETAPFEVPNGWAWVRFGAVVSVSGGVTLGRKTPIANPVLLPYLRVANVQRWRLDLSEMKSVVIDESELARFELRAGDLLITEGGDSDKVGRTAIWRDELSKCVHQNHVFKARGVLDGWVPAWAELYLNSASARSYFAGSAKKTTNLASINMTELKACPFPVPPVGEQHRIVARVDQLRGFCSALREKLAASRAVEARLVAALIEKAEQTGV